MQHDGAVLVYGGGGVPEILRLAGIHMNNSPFSSPGSLCYWPSAMSFIFCLQNLKTFSFRNA